MCSTFSVHFIDIWWIFSKPEHCGCLVKLDTVHQYFPLRFKCKVSKLFMFTDCIVYRHYSRMN